MRRPAGSAKPDDLNDSVVDPRAVIFDLDGTLLDTLEDIATSANQVLEELGFPARPIDAYRQFIGEGIGTLFARALPEGVASKIHMSSGSQSGVFEAYGNRGTWPPGPIRESPNCSMS